MKNQLENSGSYLGFTDDKPALQKNRIEAYLDKVFRYSDGVMARKDAMLLSLRNGKKPEVVEEVKDGRTKKFYRMSWGNYYNDITKTEYDFCIYLIEHDLISEESVNAFIDAENLKKEKAIEEQKKAEEAVRKERERKEVEKKAFKSWLKSASEMYIGTTKGNLLEQIYISTYGGYPASERAYDVLACIDNIENPLCREELKARLHLDNKVSRKVFYCVTGLKIPNTNKESMKFLDKVQKSDYLGTVEYKECKKPEKHSNENTQETFYILGRDKEKKAEFTPVMGNKISYNGIEMFIHKLPDGKIGISSIKCGIRVSVGKNKTEAVQNMKDLVKKFGKDKIQNQIDNAADIYGISPYLKQA